MPRQLSTVYEIDVFADMIDLQVIVYLDDILVYLDNLTEHRTHTFGKCSVDFALTLLPVQINVNSTSPPVNTLGICYLLKVL